MLCQNDLKGGKKVARGEFKLQIKKTILSGLLWWPTLKHVTAPNLLFFQGVKFPKKETTANRLPIYSTVSLLAGDLFKVKPLIYEFLHLTYS